ncbi:cysteine hydrolase family protein [Tabrizicola sp. TH137]|uniref:cysteine hydrolase family protein n=1 Tax=Tabrizicola sp. TH137 TaxID=2067452 RepID=UPI001C1F33EA|nr:cysteine hydrolase family protein [Tabrizicola sp. TH137]
MEKSVSLQGKALILIDFQRGFEDPFWGDRNNPSAEENARGLIEVLRSSSGQIIHVRHLSSETGSPLAGPGAAFKRGFEPRSNETVYEKTVNSAFIGTTLEEDLRRAEVRELIICGLTTPHCVSTTIRMAANLGFSVELAHDACAAFTRNANVSFDGGPPPSANEIHRAAVYHLHGEFAQAVLTSDLVVRWQA